MGVFRSRRNTILFSDLETNMEQTYTQKTLAFSKVPLAVDDTRVKPTSVSQELYSEVQTQYLPQVLGCLLQPLAEEMEMLSLSELTHALRTCFKVLSKVQMPPSYLDMEPAWSRSLVRAGRGRSGFSRLMGPWASLDRKKN